MSECPCGLNEDGVRGSKRVGCTGPGQGVGSGVGACFGRNGLAHGGHA